MLLVFLCVSRETSIFRMFCFGFSPETLIFLNVCVMFVHRKPRFSLCFFRCFTRNLDFPYVFTRFLEPYLGEHREGHFRPADRATPPGTGYGGFLFLFDPLEHYSCTSC